MTDLIQRLRDEAKMWRGNIEALEATGCDEIELETADHERLIAALKEAADTLERLTAGNVKTPEHYYHVVQVYDGSINHIPYVKPEDAIDYGNRKDAAGYLRGVLAERERCALVCLASWGIDGSFTAEEFAAAIRKGTP